MNFQMMKYLFLSGPIIFIVITFILGFLTPDYSHKDNFISELSLKKYGWIQKINFLISGILIAGLCFLVAYYSTNIILKIGWYLGTLVGISLFFIGIFDTDFGLVGRNLSGKIHEFIYLKIGIPIVGAVYFVLGWGYQNTPVIWIFSWILAILSFIIYQFGRQLGIKIGISQRIIVFLAIIWLEMLAIKTLSG